MVITALRMRLPTITDTDDAKMVSHKPLLSRVFPRAETCKPVGISRARSIYCWYPGAGSLIVMSGFEVRNCKSLEEKPYFKLVNAQ